MKTVNNIHLHKLVNSMMLASKKIQYPKIKLTIQQKHETTDPINGIKIIEIDDQPIVLKLSSATARFPNSVNITDGKAFTQARWYGRILKSGTLELSALGEAIETELVQLLVAFDENPESVAKIYGQQFGHCCFCGLTLTNKDSVAAGYGPICAENYGLPWAGMATTKRNETIESDIVSEFKLDEQSTITIKEVSADHLLKKIDNQLNLWHSDKLSGTTALNNIISLLQEI